MNANDMLDFVLGQVEGPTRRDFERALDADPAANAAAERARRSLHLLLDDEDEHSPPAGLADRTIQLVAETNRRRRAILDFAPAAVPFRLADVGVAAAVLLAGVLTLLPAAQRSRERMSQAGCSYNLQQLGRALWLYGGKHHHYPFGAEVDPKAPVGSYIAMLHDDGHLSDTELASIDCPCPGGAHAHDSMPNVQTVNQMYKTNPTRSREVLCSNYAYNVGYQNASLNRVVPYQADHDAIVPLLADQPPHRDGRVLRTGNSLNHGGRGQNVLYSDLHVGWHNSRKLNPDDDDMYLNKHHEAAPGVGPKDAALLPSLAPFLGW